MNTETSDRYWLTDQEDAGALKWLYELDELDWGMEDQGQGAPQATNSFPSISAGTSADHAMHEGSFSSEGVLFPQTTDWQKSQLSVVDVPLNRATESTIFQAQPTPNSSSNSTGEDAYSCQTSVTSFPSNWEQRQTHRLNCTCQVCGKTFRQRGGLLVHTRIHTGERPYACPHCSSRFKQSGHLTAHLRTHTGERPYACHLCPAAFRQTTALILHIRKHTNELPFRCSLCPTAFRTKQRLLYHLNMHTDSRPYLCSLCPDAFRQKTSLESHRLIHTDSKPNGCPHCPKTFRQRSSLTYHLRMHSGEKPYPCGVCGKQFRSSSNRRAHQRTHQ